MKITCSVLFFGRGAGEWSLMVKDPALELWLSLITQQRVDGQEVNISNFRSLGTGFIEVLSSCYSIENLFPLCLFWTHAGKCINRYLRKDTFEQRTTRQLEMRPLSFNMHWHYCPTSPYWHLYNTDTSLLWTVCLVPDRPKIIHSLPL